VQRIIALSVTAFLLAGCQPEAPGGGEAAPPADAPAPAPAVDPAAEFKVDFSARGNEPFWRVDIKGSDIVLTRPDGPAVTATNAGLAVTDGQATWTAQAGATAVAHGRRGGTGGPGDVAVECGGTAGDGQRRAGRLLRRDERSEVWLYGPGDLGRRDAEGLRLFDGGRAARGAVIQDSAHPGNPQGGAWRQRRGLVASSEFGNTA